jgi:hypothetical protein
MFQGLIKVFVNDWYGCLEPKRLGAEWLADYSTLIAPQKGRHTIPSIIPPILKQDHVNTNDDMVSDQDEVLEEPAEVTTEQDANSQIHNDFVQIMAEG